MDMVGLTYLNMLVVKKVFTLSKYNFFLGIHKNSNIYEKEEIKNLMKFIWKENIDLKKLMWSEVILLCHFPFSSSCFGGHKQENILCTCSQDQDAESG